MIYDMLIPLRFDLEKKSDAEDFDIDGSFPVRMPKPTVYSIDIEVLDLRSLEPRTLRLEARHTYERPELDPVATIHVSRGPVGNIVTDAQRDYLRRLRDKIDEVLGA